MDKQLEFLFRHVYAGKSIDDLAQEYKPFEIFDKEDIQYHLWARQICGTASIKLAKELRKFKEGYINPEFGVQFLKDFTKKEITEEELRKYSVKMDVQLQVANPDFLNVPTEGQYSKTFGNLIFFDSKFNFCILYESLPVMCAGFDPDDKRIVVRQIQGVKTTDNTPFEQINLQKAALRYICEFAAKNQIPEVEVISVINNFWVKVTFDLLTACGAYSSGLTLKEAANMSLDEERRILNEINFRQEIRQQSIHLMPAQGFMIYDVTARRCGFKKNECGNYSKKIQHV